MNFKNKLYAKQAGLLITALFLFISVQAQDAYRDFNFWTSATIKHNLTQRLSSELSLVNRRMENASKLDQFFVEGGVSFDITKEIKVGTFYRFINKNKNNEYLSKRHRWYFDLSYKKKINPVTLTLRSRYQWTISDLKSSDFGYLPEAYWRNKLNLKFDLNKKYAPYLSTEIFLLTNSLYEVGYADAVRYGTGIEFEFNRVHALDAGFIFQTSKYANIPTEDFIFALGYNYTY